MAGCMVGQSQTLWHMVPSRDLHASSYTVSELASKVVTSHPVRRS